MPRRGSRPGSSVPKNSPKSISETTHAHDQYCPPCLRTPAHHLPGLYSGRGHSVARLRRAAPCVCPKFAKLCRERATGCPGGTLSARRDSDGFADAVARRPVKAPHGSMPLSGGAGVPRDIPASRSPPQQFGASIKIVAAQSTASTSLPCERLPEVRGFPGESRQGGAGQRAPRFARYALSNPILRCVARDGDTDRRQARHRLSRRLSTPPAARGENRRPAPAGPAVASRRGLCGARRGRSARRAA